MIEVYENALRETAIFRHAEHYCRVGLNIHVHNNKYVYMYSLVWPEHAVP